jgi:hypothetical protein
MTHEDAGRYSAKHPTGTVSDPAITAALTEKAEDGRVTCTAAHDIARNFGVAPSEVGKTSDLLEYRITRCQLSLFGYAPEKKTVEAAEEISDDLRDHPRRAAADGKIVCASCWTIAETLGIEKMAVSAACELFDIKIRRCQLGAF